MISTLCAVLALLISVSAFIHGALRIIKEEKPLFCQIIMWAVGCYCLQCISTCVSYLCGDFSDLGIIGSIANCGFFFALLSANYGSLDNAVDDKTEYTRNARRIALIAPVVAFIAIIAVFFHLRAMDVFTGTVYTLSLLPIIPASYFCLKHLLLPMDDMAFLMATKPCNLVCLVIFAASILMPGIYRLVPYIVSDLFYLTISVLVFLLTLSAEKGARTWPI